MENKMEKLMATKWTPALLAILCCLLWGSAIPAMKIGNQLFQIDSGDYFTQMLFAGCRFSLAGIIVIVVLSLKARRLAIPRRKGWKQVFLLGMVQTTLQYGFYYIGLSNVSGVEVAVIQGFSVFITVLVSSFVFRLEKFTFIKCLGCAMGLMGIILVNVNSLKAGSGSLFGGAMVLISTFGAAFSSSMIKWFSQENDPVLFNGYQFLLGGLVLILIGLLGGGRLRHGSIMGLGMIGYLAFVSAMAYSLWSLLLKYRPVSQVAIFNSMTPAFGVIFSCLLLGESNLLSYWTLLALALVCGGIVVINCFQPQTQEAASTLGPKV